MANSCTNMLTVEASADLFEKIKQFLTDDNPDPTNDFSGSLSFDRLLSDTSSLTRLFTIEENLRKFYLNSGFSNFLATTKILGDFEATFGTRGIYSDGTEWEDQTICFYSVSSGPSTLCELLSHEFPDAAFTLYYMEEGNRLYGYANAYTDNEHVIATVEEYDYGTDESKEVYEAIIGDLDDYSGDEDEEDV